jgi:hypothetical protein
MMKSKWKLYQISRFDANKLLLVGYRMHIIMDGCVCISVAMSSHLHLTALSYMQSWTHLDPGTTLTWLKSCTACSWMILCLVFVFLLTRHFLVSPIDWIIAFWPLKRRGTGFPRTQGNLRSWRFLTNRFSLQVKQRNGGWGQYRDPSAAWNDPCLQPTTSLKPIQSIWLSNYINFAVDQLE